MIVDLILKKNVNTMAEYKKTQQKVGNAMDMVKKGALRLSNKLTDKTTMTGLSGINKGSIKMKKESYQNRIVVTHHNPSWDTYSFF